MSSTQSTPRTGAEPSPARAADAPSRAAGRQPHAEPTAGDVEEPTADLAVDLTAESTSADVGFAPNLRLFATELKPWRFEVFAVVLLSFGTGALETAAIALAVVTLGSVMMDGEAVQMPDLFGFSLPSVDLAIALGVSAVVLRWMLASFSDWLKIRIVTDWAVSLRGRLFETFLRAEWRLQSAERAAAVQERVFQNTTMVSNLQQVVFSLLQAVVSLAALLLGAFWLSPAGAAIALVVSLMLMLLLRPLSRWAMGSSRAMVKAMMSSAELVRSCIDMVREVTVFGVKEPAQRAVLGALREQEAHRRRSLLLGAVSSQLYFSLVLLACWGAIAALNLVEPGQVLALGAVGLLLLRSLGYTRSIQSGIVNVRTLMPLYEDLSAFEQRLSVGERELDRGTQRPDDFDLRFEELSFTYPESDLPALEELSFEVPRGSSLAVVGPSGSGKSTLAQIVLGLRRATSGRLFLGGVPVEDVDPEWWRGATAVVTQEALLLDATIRENVRFFRPEIGEAAIWSALQDVGLQEFVQELPERLETLVGEHGARLSGGQRQRLCIARALAGQPRILVLDEPTSALDVHSERVVQQCLDDLGERCTRIVIAHRLSTIRQCATVLVLDEGRVLDVGSPSDVERRLDYFREALELSDASTPVTPSDDE